jgi:hypothetical protein
VVWCGFKNKHQKVMFEKDVGLHVENIIITLDLVANIIGDVYDLYK